MTRLCAGRPPEWWLPADPGARRALALCGRCPVQPTCLEMPPADPEPHGVIRAGVAYSDAGAALPLCRCGYPHTTYTGGTVPSCCRRCRTPQAAPRVAPDVQHLHHLVALGQSDNDIAKASGVSVRTVVRRRLRAGIHRKPGPRPKTERTAA